MKKLALIVLAALAASACATLSSTYKQGTQAEMARLYDEAIAQYEKAVLENPKESVYRLALERAKLSASLSHLREARRLADAGKRSEAQAEYAKALSYNPRNTQIALEARTRTAEPAPKAEPVSEKIEYPIKLKARDEAVQAHVPTESSLRSIFLAVGKSAGINVVFDENFRDVPFTTDISGQTFEGAIRSICQATKNFYRIIDERTVIIVPDQPLKRIQYEINCIRTFSLSNILAQDAFAALTQMLRTQYTQPMIIFDKSLNTVSVRGTPEIVELADKLIRTWDKPKGEVIIDLEIMEVSRVKLRQLGLDFENNYAGMRYGMPGSTTDPSAGWYSLKDIDFSNPANLVLSLPVAYLQFLESDTDTKIIAQPRLRGLSDEKITHKVGQKVPIPKTTFTPFAAGGVSQQPITNYDYQEVGIEINFTPRVHLEKEVTLEVDLKVSSLGGVGYADIPILNNREIKNMIRLKDGETQLIAGLLRDEERKTIKGIPGLKSIPGIGRLFGAEDTTIEQTDVILTITPYIIRSLPMGPDDQKPVWVDLSSVGSSLGEGSYEDAGLDAGLEGAEAQPGLAQRAMTAGGANSISLTPAEFDLPAGREFRVAVNVRTDQDLSAMSVSVSYDARIMTLKDVSEGGISRQFGAGAPFLKNIDNASGTCTLGFSSPQMGKGAKGGGTLALLLFEAKAAGEGMLTVSGVSGMSADGGAVVFSSQDAHVMIR